MSTASAARFSERARATRLLALRPLLVALAVVGVLAACGWVLLGSPWTRVEQIGVAGTQRVDPVEVRSLAEPLKGTPLVKVPVDRLAQRVEQLELVTDAEVVRVWPASLEIRVTERVPVAAVAAGGGIELLDADGVVVAREPEPPADLPLVDVDVRRSGARTLTAVAEVLAALPDELSGDVAAAGAGSPDDVWLEMSDGARVLWGSSAQPDAKAQVLTVLMVQRPADVYDVRAPGAPVTS